MYYLTALISGGALMGLELLGSRILAPFFGNSIFVWGALISVFLTGLAAGNFIGGKIADKLPAPKYLAGIIFLGSVMIAALPFIYPFINQWIFNHDFGYKLNPLMASLVLFLLPGALMGMVSPYCIKLSADELRSIGKISGRIYAISTAGSIIGTLGTTFFLIPMWGTKTNTLILSVLLLISSIMLFFGKNSNKFTEIK